ncbi:hypothetical protein DEAC_c30300 [Desulfosporosinus acididurans]|uniref:Polysaccharide biosynthesis protein with aminopeptidase-like domain protein n=1 Tax=Desulfosporosinus acididurans TaxID=476652 RepID=A0A0J1FQ32_9FIRM|nr:DUF4910 domain-containing protein [Desulfosporosinus acididurans]KLU65063.1 hypothetical protein DEAC_c30300 [Desulfosporosinus acididurans]
MPDTTMTGEAMYRLAEELFPICRSITGEGVRQTLKIIQEHIPLKIKEVPSGSSAFDWTVPNEWNIVEAYVEDQEGNKVIDFKKNNLHVVGYSVPIDQVMSLQELQQHLYSIESMPEAIPYVTSYYKERWGFCLSHQLRLSLKEGQYRVCINSSLTQGSLTYGELIIPGETEKEIFLSTYVCHPSMANNELSGPAVVTYLAKWLLELPRRKYTYRIVFVPETIGSLVYLSKNLKEMKKNVVAGFNISCVGDERAYSFLPSRYGNTLADRVALNVLTHKHPEFVRYSYLERGSDERQYCSPGVDLPMASIMRTKYGVYPEYHTSLDDLSLISPAGLQGSFDVLKDCIKLLEINRKYRIKCLGEPQLGRRGLYPTISTRESGNTVRNMMNFIAYADGSNDLLDISEIIGLPVDQMYPIVDALLKADLIE